MEIKDVKNWSYNELDDAIISNKKEIVRLENEIKLLREVKSQKTMTDSLAMITDFDIDFSLEDLQAFLASRRNVVAKITEETPKENSKTVFPADAENRESEISQSNEIAIPNDAEKKNEKAVEQNFTATADEILNNPTTETFEKTKVQPENESEKMLQTIAKQLNLPEDATLTEVKARLEANKNHLPTAWSNHFEDAIGKIERGEFA